MVPVNIFMGEKLKKQLVDATYISKCYNLNKHKDHYKQNKEVAQSIRGGLLWS